MRFREIILSSGKIVWLGKDAEQNEELVKKFIGKENLIIHTEKPGSPFCVFLEKPDEKEKKEAAIFCAAYSHDWRDNKKDVKVNLFSGKNIFKEKNMPKGTFRVKKTKTIIAKKGDVEKVRK